MMFSAIGVLTTHRYIYVRVQGYTSGRYLYSNTRQEIGYFSGDYLYNLTAEDFQL
jgi:hypothetical protein